MRLTRSELSGADLVWLVDVQIRGKVYRFSSMQAEVSDGSRVLQYSGALAPIVHPDEAAPWDSALAERSIEISAIFSGEGFAALASTDHDLGDSTCQISLWRVGSEYSDREVILDGQIDEPVYSSAQDPVSFSVRESALLDRGRVLSPLATVTEETWSSGTYRADPAIIGEPYPLPFGRPGALIGGLTEHHGSPALLVQIDAATQDNSLLPATVLIGDGELSCVGSTVLLQNKTPDPETSATVTATAMTDDLGRVVTVASVSVGTLAIAEGDELWISFRTAGSGGITAPTGGLMTGAGDVISWLLQRSSLNIDTLQVLGSAGLLNGYELDFFRNVDQGTWQAALDVIAELPASFALGPRGLQVIHWRLDAIASDAVGHLNTSTEAGDLAGSISRTSRDQVSNVLTIDYALDPQSSIHRQRLVYGPDQWIEPDAGYQQHALCSASYTRYRDALGRPLIAPAISSSLIQDAGTAAAVLHSEALRRCGTHTEGRFEGLSQSWQYLNPGDVILVSHSPVGWSEQVCLVTSVDRAPGSTAVAVLSPNHWIRDAL